MGRLSSEAAKAKDLMPHAFECTIRMAARPDRRTSGSSMACRLAAAISVFFNRQGLHKVDAEPVGLLIILPLHLEKRFK